MLGAMPDEDTSRLAEGLLSEAPPPPPPLPALLVLALKLSEPCVRQHRWQHRWQNGFRCEEHVH
jgi:hypothetical protein